jgi:hypothetical protein
MDDVGRVAFPQLEIQRRPDRHAHREKDRHVVVEDVIDSAVRARVRQKGEAALVALWAQVDRLVGIANLIPVEAEGQLRHARQGEM